MPMDPARAENERYIGRPVPRREDRPLLTGEERFADDLTERRQVYLGIARSQYAHARIADVDTSAAAAADGVLAVYTAADLEASDVGTTDLKTWYTPLEDGVRQLNRPLKTPKRPLLAEERVRYTGEPIAVVLADAREQAASAADRVAVDYERLDAVTDPTAAVESDAPQLHEMAPDNIAFDWAVGDEADVGRAFEAAAYAVDLDLDSPRLVPNPMEPRAVLADYRQSDNRLSIRPSSQVPHEFRTLVSEVLGLPEHRISVDLPAVGGGFGQKSKFYPAELLAAWASTQVGRPVKWVATRSESYRVGIHGRSHRTTGALALDTDGQFLALRVTTHADVGAYLSKVTPMIATDAYASTLAGQYRLPSVYCNVIGVFTNAAPVDAYRGAGRPQAAYVLERLVGAAADALAVDPAAIRRRNFIAAEAFPYETPTGTTYDSGDYEPALERALDIVGYDSLDADGPPGVARGIGLACFVEKTGTANIESSIVRVHPSGDVTAVVGTADQGQGHGTTFAQIVADELSVDLDRVDVAEGDTDATPQGTGTYASQSTQAGGTAVYESARTVRERARRIAAHQLEAAPADVGLSNGSFHITGATQRSITFREIAAAAHDPGALPADMEPGLEARTTYESATTYPFGAHVAVVDVDRETGAVSVVRYVAVDDCGTRINPRIVEGQTHGAIAQGIGQALYEAAIYDDTGNLVTGSMQDYAVPKTHHVPELTLDHTVTPSPTNPLGVKGAGETGAIGPPAAIANAVADALDYEGVDRLELPLTDETVWRAMVEN